MKFEWDRKKRLANIAKHGMDFADAPDLFNGPFLVAEDDRRAYGETRHLAIGQVNGREAVVAFTCRGEKIRIISMRKANSREQKKYREKIRDRLGKG